MDRINRSLGDPPRLGWIDIAANRRLSANVIQISEKR
ncbi:hypothetical protein J2Z17_001970 [Rhizobium halophytocola]|uniref:Uncharacterized protein n=1 Tax=Rhizobium halophytocola TaxID=735519 RepID=A0ABS4DXW8_9HYPH|nr:hypothetical protein [Rhizobium halophytocola]